ncbi:proteic killer suppression protein [Lishizhenia tianjinensis]|uniref:Proteic killer suppression protein n=1 Tax=Lishizhenia tianjinensis TaxID=477690 RepID=A0A1I6XD93_9FLAO|nr:type II toxin-antitoxin system RelE/ParE family toxin [Lishizhenia tianjinensis]SFT36258.1 proteic killer suppression protein [Lishizhenia tianjinensis]
MNITFATTKLEKYANQHKVAVSKLGMLRAKKLKQRLDDLSAASSLEDVRYLPGKYHELTGDRKGQWACDLDQPYRLIFEPHENPIPTNKNGQYLWIEILGVEIIEITDYH